MAVKLLILDLDGTLFDTRADIVNAVNLARRSFGLEPLPFERVVAMVGNGVRVLAERAFRDSEINADQVVERIMEFYGPHAADTAELYPTVRETLPLLYPILAIVSNKPKQLVDSLLRKSSIEHYFDFVAGGDTFDQLKPDPMAVNFLAQKYKVKPEEVLIVGDHSPDIEMAKAAGARSVYCNYGFFGKDTQGADFTVDQFSELPGIIKTLEKGRAETSEKRPRPQTGERHSRSDDGRRNHGARTGGRRPGTGDRPQAGDRRPPRR